MTLIEKDGFIIAHKPGIEFHPDCINNLISVMNHFALDISCPILPAYHRRHGIYESNLVHPFRTHKVELHENCIIFRLDVWNKILNFDLRVIEGKIKEYGLKGGLICNAIIYAG